MPAVSVESALSALTDRHPSLTPLVWAKDGAVNPIMVLFLNDRQLGAEEIGTHVGPGEVIDIVPALEGG